MPFPLNIRFIKKAEERLGRNLPHAYKARMLRENGGELLTGTDCWQLFPILDDSDRKRLKRTCNDIVYESKQATNRPGFPKDAVAIGTNGGGDLLVLLAEPGSNQFGDAVLWWDHETDELHKVADAFSEL